MDGSRPLDRISFQPELPVSGDTLRRHVEAALALGLPPVSQMMPVPRRLRVIANGPSALQAPMRSRAITLALNGALRLFNNAGRVPHFHAVCDPQPLVAGFLDQAPIGTRYLVASRCHPAVFAALREREVYLWHLEEEETAPLLTNYPRVQAGVSVTIAALTLFHDLGCRRFDLWGLDCCFAPGGNSHAGQGSTGSRPQAIRVGDRLFQSTPAWALEAQQFIAMAHALDVDITVHGDGLVAAILERMAARQVNGPAELSAPSAPVPKAARG